VTNSLPELYESIQEFTRASSLIELSLQKLSVEWMWCRCGVNFMGERWHLGQRATGPPHARE